MAQWVQQGRYELPLGTPLGGEHEARSLCALCFVGHEVRRPRTIVRDYVRTHIGGWEWAGEGDYCIVFFIHNSPHKGITLGVRDIGNIYIYM